MTMTHADVDRLEQLASMLEAIPRVAAEARRILAADQAIMEANEHARKINLENADVMQVSASVRDEIHAARAALVEYEHSTKDTCEKMFSDAEQRANSLVSNATATAKEVLLRAHDAADEARREAATIDKTLLDKREELSLLEAKATKIRDYIKKMAGD